MYDALKPIKPRKIYEEIIDQVKQLIAEGVLNPGDKLISEKELAEKLQVGRSAVREAFRALEAMGILEIRPGEGTFVRRVEPQALINVLSLVLIMDRDTTEELMELRKILEVESAGLAALRHTPEELALMEEALAQMEADIKAGDLGEKADWKFHYAIAEATHNSLLVELMNTIAGTMQRVLRTARMQLYMTPGTPQRLLNEHKAIFLAIKEGRDQDARRAMFDHLDKVEKGLRI
ncbi:GntR family transcriptional repressor for pyruvate dehydrogenase complex [Desulfofundulus luciae]|uniref:GntR family transcriptional repressor for pyruvate dehydrogenase complex n=1 Tax=Desulfofundulus luciae TaxID=74702 RepID=A0ABU0B0D6_9FIRM|nr:FadR/GntR family transcriptional regulator [Desulfofundulus luciae]MDQ0286186.1 GntR family transcriptional repressor for pyruvate dehydrogenase complex [Desulfofundulus luciae]